ncbi:hypothetical protein [Erythrobacter sp. JK5]|uniref:hypothetical protein n=1 Tax=Erythrobacter sp. JK5 TaxID=2829500 RepID=UPI001BA5968C|nr:hypothetical protein [Erythrobacter sp. JK5]QUL36871.1 hypothetical protein KDC96_10665 [Erythrobacter sp. JK5]
MSAGAALLMIVQSAAPVAADAQTTRRPVPGVTVSASARILQPAIVRYRPRDAVQQVSAESAVPPQRSRDAAGTVWFEFN